MPKPNGCSATRRDELIGELVELLVPDSVCVDCPFRTPRPLLRESGTPPDGSGSQLSVRRRDGSEFPAEISLSGLETEDGLLVSAAIRDVTERLEVQAEAERLRAEAEARALRGPGPPVATAREPRPARRGGAHDFNNLLAVILNYAAFVKEEVGSILDPVRTDASESVIADLGQIELAAQKATS